MSDTVVDASVWVSRLVVGDVHHERCRDWFENQAASEGFLVSPVSMLAEVAGAISRRTGQHSLAHEAVALIQALPNLRLVSVDQPVGRLAADLAGDGGLRGADALYVATAASLGLTLVTLDREQLERASPYLTAVPPTPLEG
jgi:predicted nucleic acid-binding protein